MIKLDIATVGFSNIFQKYANPIYFQISIFRSIDKI